MSVRLSAYISAAQNWTHFREIQCGNFDENLSINSKIRYNRTKASGTLHEDLSVLHTASSEIYSATIQRSIAVLPWLLFNISTLLTGTFVLTESKANAVLPFVIRVVT
jgi:hypothetical protein